MTPAAVASRAASAGGLPGVPGASRDRKPPRKAESPSRRRGGLPGGPGTNRATSDLARAADNAPPESRVDSAEAWGRARLDSYCTKWVTDTAEATDTARREAMTAKRLEWEATAERLEALASRLRGYAGQAPASGAAGDMRAMAGKLARRAKRWRGRVRWCVTTMDTLTAGCGDPTTSQTQCGCGRRWVERRCRQKWSCDRCRKRWCRRQRARMWQAMGGRTDRAYLVTPTVRHSGDPAADWAKLQEGWRVFRRWLARHLGASPDYVRLWEATGGDDNRGHVHAHLVVYARRIDYAAAVAAWRRAMHDAGAVIDFRVVKNPKQAVRYVSKYVSKGVDLASMSAETGGKLEAAAYGRRMVSTSRGFFAPYVSTCRRCACCFSPPFKATWDATAREVRARSLLAAYATGGDLHTGPP